MERPYACANGLSQSNPMPVMNWTGVQLNLESLPVFIRCRTHLKIEICTLCILQSWDGFHISWTLVNSQDPAAPQSNSSCLEIDHFGETTTGNVKIEQHFHWNQQKNKLFQGTQLYHLNWNVLFQFYFINVWTAAPRNAGPCERMKNKLRFLVPRVWVSELVITLFEK